MNTAIAFDFDGVIVNSIEALKTAYFGFLADYGCQGSHSEFDSLNGPALHEIVDILREKHNIDDTADRLLKHYHLRLRDAYAGAPLMDGAVDCLTFLRDQQIFTALVTSSARPEVERFLDRHNIRAFFDRIVTGDEVKNSKPSPEIYLKVKNEFPQYAFWVVEDSRHGLAAATRAGMRVAYFDRFGLGTDIGVDCRITALSDIIRLVVGLRQDWWIIEESSQIEISIDPEYVPEIASPDDESVDRIWAAALEEHKLTDGKVLYYRDHVLHGATCVVRGFWAPYRYFYSRLQAPKLDLPFIPLAVSGVCQNAEGAVLLAQRSDVTEYQGRSEFVPSGGISERHGSDRTVAFKDQLVEEFVEETGQSVDAVTSIEKLALVRDLHHNVVDICCVVGTNLRSDMEFRHSAEYCAMEWVLPSQLAVNRLVPTSVAILDVLNARR